MQSLARGVRENIPQSSPSAHNSSQFRRRSLQAARSRDERTPMALITSLLSIVANWAFNPHGTFNPAALQSIRARSTFGSCDEMGTTNKSPAKLLLPTTMAGRTLRLVKSVNGIGSRMISLIAKLIENVINRIVPSLHQSLLRPLQPGFTSASRVGIRFGLDGNDHWRFFRQRQWEDKFQHPVFVNGLDRGAHRQRIAPSLLIGKKASFQRWPT